MSIVRLRGVRFRVTVHDPIRLAETSDREHDTREGLALINRFLEDRIREHPDQYFWVHRRWPKPTYKETAA